MTDTEALPGRIYRPTIKQLRELASDEVDGLERRVNIFFGESCTYNTVAFTFSESPISGMTIRILPSGATWPADLVEWIEPCTSPIAPAEPGAAPGRIYKPTVEQLRELAREEGRRFNCSVRTSYGAGDCVYEEVMVRLKNSGTVVILSDEEGDVAVKMLEFIQWIEPCTSPIATAKPEAAHTPPRKAPEILRCAADKLAERGRQYDKDGEERSMAKVVQIFNLVHGTNLTPEQGWDFMATLKQVRAFAQPGTVHEDSMIDRIAYVALCEEEARKG